VALRGVFWRAAERAAEIAPRGGLDVVYSIERNTSRCSRSRCPGGRRASGRSCDEMAAADRIGIAIFGAAFLSCSIWRSAPQPAARRLGRTRHARDRRRPAEHSGELLNLLRDAENFRSSTTSSHLPGRRRSWSARVSIPNRAGRQFTVKAREAEWRGPGPHRDAGRGALESSDGLVAKTRRPPTARARDPQGSRPLLHQRPMSARRSG